MDASPVALITGAGRGIGRATAVALAGRGYRLAIAARTTGELRQTASLAGEGVLVISGDVAEAADRDRMLREVMDHYGRVDALVNNAGYAPVLPIEQLTPELWRRIIDTNLTAPIALMRAVWPGMKARGGGVIVNVSSAAARDPFAGLGAYGAAKAGLGIMGLALAREGHPHGIRVHTVAPSAVETEMFRGIITPEQVPTRDVLDPSDVADLIAACVTGDLRYTSGETLWVHKTV